MKINYLLAFIISAFLSCSAFAGETLNLTALDKNQVTQLLKGKTITAGPGSYIKHKFTPQTLKIYYSTDGTLQGKILNPTKGQKQFDQGTWVVKGDGTQCNTWNNWGAFCMSIYQIKDHYLIINDDKTEMLFLTKDQISEGNSISK